MELIFGESLFEQDEDDEQDEEEGEKEQEQQQEEEQPDNTESKLDLETLIAKSNSPTVLDLSMKGLTDDDMKTLSRLLKTNKVSK